MEKEKPTPMGEPSLIDFNGHLLFISEPAPGKISINFDELHKNMKHCVNNYQLTKINYKTVIGSLKNTHPNILSAKLDKNADELYQLTVTVSYEFLPEIKESIIFEKKEIEKSESEQIAVKNMRNYLSNIKEQIATLTNVQVRTGGLEYNGNQDFELYVAIPHKRCIFTWGLNLIKPATTTVKPQMWYYNTLTKQRKNTKSIPDQGIFVNHNNDAAYVEMRFLAEQEDFDSVIFQITGGKYEGDYLVSIERVEQFA